MFPVNFVTDVPGCTSRHATQIDAMDALRYE
jgi:hypothetical protein